ncbi:hypothetical protein P8452_72058 [Trifolium repens]|nr:hypothetical protein P8452_72058 [Trifolium repens]
MDGENTEQREIVTQRRRRKIDKRSQNLFSALLQVTLLSFHYHYGRSVVDDFGANFFCAVIHSRSDNS